MAVRQLNAIENQGGSYCNKTGDRVAIPHQRLGREKMKTLSSLVHTLLLLLVPRVVFGLYSDGKDFSVQVIDKKAHFEKEVVRSDGIWMVQFFAPWCGHCKNLAPQYKAMAKMLKGIIHVAAVDATSDGGQRIASGYGVEGFPTLYIFAQDKKKPTKYEGSRDPNAMIQALMDATVQTIQSRVTGGGGGSSEKSNKGPSKVVQLNQNNYQKQVLDNPLVSLVAFIAPWCGHCKQLLPEWEIAAQKVDGQGAFLGVVDATVETQLASVYGVNGYPTIKVFPGGAPKTHSDAQDYMGGRTASSIAKFALEEVDRTGVPKEIPELVSSSTLEENCSGGQKNKLCVLAALPHILDSGAAGRNKYRDLLAVVSKSFRGSAFDFMWFEGGSQPSMEQSLELTFGYPAVVAVSMEKQAYIVHHGSFSEKGVSGFLNSIMTGRQASVKLPQMFDVVTVEPWDGKDGLPLEEEPPLSEIMGWDDDEEGGEL